MSRRGRRGEGFHFDIDDHVTSQRCHIVLGIARASCRLKLGKQSASQKVSRKVGLMYMSWLCCDSLQEGTSLGKILQQFAGLSQGYEIIPAGVFAKAADRRASKVVSGKSLVCLHYIPHSYLQRLLCHISVATPNPL